MANARGLRNERRDTMPSWERRSGGRGRSRLPEEAARLEKRYDHIYSVYDHRFRM